jgi:hypothetical protein
MTATRGTERVKEGGVGVGEGFGCHLAFLVHHADASAGRAIADIGEADHNVTVLGNRVERQGVAIAVGRSIENPLVKRVHGMLGMFQLNV